MEKETIEQVSNYVGPTPPSELRRVKMENTMKKSQRIIIEVDKSISVEDALLLVKSVINSGKISEAAGIKHYCWVSSWKGENISGKKQTLVVSTRKKKAKDSADSFYVYATK